MHTSSLHAPCFTDISLTRAYLHALGLHLLHDHSDVDLAGVAHVLLRLNVDLLNQPARIDVVDGILPVINVVVLALLRSGRAGKKRAG
jgi:hypothetical protein